MKPDLRLFMNFKINTSIPKKIVRTITINVLESGETEFTFHGPDIVFDVVMQWRIAFTWHCPIYRLTTHIRNTTETIRNISNRICTLDKVVYSFC